MTPQSQNTPPPTRAWRWWLAFLPAIALLGLLMTQFRWAAFRLALGNLPKHTIMNWQPGVLVRPVLTTLLLLFIWMMLNQVFSHRSRLWGFARVMLAWAVWVGTISVYEFLGPGLAYALKLLTFACTAYVVFILLKPATLETWEQKLRGRFRFFKGPRFYSGGTFAWVLRALVLITALYALAPASESDELRYHLSTPATWERQGRMAYLPYQAFSNFPMLAERLFQLVHVRHDDFGAAKLLHVFFFLICIALTGLLTRMAVQAVAPAFALRRSFGWGAALAFACIPFAPILAGWGFVDFFMTAFWLAFVYTGMRALFAKRKVSLILLGAMAGGALGTKYSMIPQLLAAGGVWLVLHGMAHHNLRRTLRAAAWIIGPAAFLSAPWYLRNYLNTGNPVYPLAWRLFGGGEWSAQNAALYLAKAHEKGWYLTTLPAALARPIELLLSPLTTALFSNKFEDHFLGPLPFMALCFGLAGCGLPRARRRRFTLLWLWAMLAIAWGLWFFTYQSNRLLLPALGLVFSLGAAGLARLWPLLAPWQQRLTRVAYTLAVAFCLVFYLTTMAFPVRGGADRIDAMLAGIGLQDRDFYLARRINYFRAAQWANTHLKPGDKLLLVGEHRTLYFEVELIASDWFDTPQPLPWLRQSRDNTEMLNQLQTAGVRYILLNAGELKKYYRDYWLRPIAGQPPRFSADEYARIALEPFRDADGRMLGEHALWQDPHLALVFEDALNEVRIYRLLPVPTP
jgi:hypothetical protein